MWATFLQHQGAKRNDGLEFRIVSGANGTVLVRSHSNNCNPVSHVIDVPMPGHLGKTSKSVYRFPLSLSLPFSDSTSWLKICGANAISGFSMPLCCDIDSEDEAWEGTIDLAIFQQVRDQQDKLRIIAKLEAQNRSNRSTPSVATRSPGRPSEAGYATATVNTSADSSKEGGSSGYRENGENKKLQARDGKNMPGCKPKWHGGYVDVDG